MMVLERSKRELEQEVHNQKIEILELQETTSQLTAQIEHLTERASTGSGHSQTLYSELSQIGGNSGPTDMTVATDTDQQLPADHSIDDEIECDDDDFPMFSSYTSAVNNQSLFQHTLGTEIRDQILYVYNCIQEICHEVRQHIEADGDIDQFSVSNGAMGGESKTVAAHLPTKARAEFKRENDKVQRNQPDHPADSPHILNIAVEELRKHIRDIIASNKKATANSCSTAVKESLEEQINELQHHMRHTQDVLQQSHIKVEQKEIELQKKNDLLREYQDKVLEYQDLISRLNKERDDLQNKKIRSLKFDAVVMQMRKERDEALDRKNNMELQLSQTKMDLLTLNSQLMEAIHQKVGVSQQLDQWQVYVESSFSCYRLLSPAYMDTSTSISNNSAFVNHNISSSFRSLLFSRTVLGLQSNENPFIRSPFPLVYPRSSNSYISHDIIGMQIFSNSSNSVCSLMNHAVSQSFQTLLVKLGKRLHYCCRFCSMYPFYKFSRTPSISRHPYM
ncbi:hypothetical protein CHS0354_007567 [Potamilus streckersoni]|uniref:Uncharacterized protein n=1 Tax=Potamilus streckersoni TaxID=2493646 RepID=A0AAE0T3P3_9BIVA|nr:hypothetical protein CHS0354_007567 [Potamilus streckersoni]